LQPNATRSNSAVVDVHALVLDVDDGTQPDVVLGALAGLELVWHTSYSHTAACPRLRAVVMLEAPVLAAAWKGVAVEAMRRWSWADKACKDASRAYYVPTAGADGDWQCGVVHGAPLDVSSWREAVPRARARRWEPGGWLAADPSAADARDPAWRLTQGLAAGGRDAGRVIRGVRCPSCDRPAVWWPVDPERTTRAMCSHRNSCGWSGRIQELT
jgi:hypothetical protein